MEGGITPGMFWEDRRGDNVYGGRMVRRTALPGKGEGAVSAYLDVGALQVAVGDPALEVGAHLLGSAVAGGGSQERFLAAPHAVGASQHRAEEGQVTAGARTRRRQPHLAAAAPAAPQPRGPQLPAATQRPLQAPRRAREVSAVERLHAAGVQRVEGLQRAAFLRAPAARPAHRRQQQRQQQGPPGPALGCHARYTRGPCDGARGSAQRRVGDPLQWASGQRVAGLSAIRPEAGCSSRVRGPAQCEFAAVGSGAPFSGHRAMDLGVVGSGSPGNGARCGRAWGSLQWEPGTVQRILA